ncbi:MAG: polysaccharide biosynthesis tyrosine autokinase [Bacteroidetes bacterium]|nr:polysaccharide biosynthesis tyrosine autokinase [Bacteroidota bacterium]
MLNAKVDSEVDRYKERVERFSSSIDFSLFLYLLLKSKYVIVAFFVIIFSLAFLYLRYSQPIYESKSKIQIISDNTASKVLQFGQVEANGNKIAEAIEQIRSKVFLKRVVEKLAIEVSYFTEGTFKSNELYTASPYFAKVNLKKPYLQGVKQQVDFKDDLSGGKITYMNGATPVSIEFKTGAWLKTKDFDVNIYLNPEFETSQIRSILNGNKSYFIVKSSDEVTAELQTKLETRVLSELAMTVLLMVKDVNPEKSKDIVNAICSEFLDFDREHKSESSLNILKFIDDQLAEVYNELKLAETKLETFKKDKNINNNEVILSSNLLRYGNLEEQLMRVEMEEKILDQIQKNITSNKNIDVYQLVSMLAGTEEESMVKDIVENIQKLLVEKENMLYAVTPNSENIKQVNYQIEIQKDLLLKSLDAVRLKYKTRYKNLLEKSVDYKAKFDQNPEDEVELSRLMRVYSISEKYYTMLLEKKTEFSISKAGFVSKNIILETAVNKGSIVSPNKKNTVYISIVSFLALSLLLVIIQYFLHDKISSLNEVIRHTSANINTLGIVPKFDKNIPVSQLIIDKSPKSLIAESFRAIRSNLQFINNEPGPKIISITSTISGEGKTFVAINIAGILAFSGKKTIIIDLDMRKPKIHRGFEVDNNKGMSTILTHMTEIDECIRDSNLPLLKYITAGPIPPNPSELIMSDTLKEVINYLKTKFDYVIVDNPPVGLVTDGLTTLQMADYPIYVFRADYSKRSFAQIIDRLKNENKIQHLSIVLNGVDLKKNIYGYNYGYGYGYGYGYTYGSGYYGDDIVKKKRKFLSKKDGAN